MTSSTGPLPTPADPLPPPPPYQAPVLRPLPYNYVVAVLDSEGFARAIESDVVATGATFVFIPPDLHNRPEPGSSVKAHGYYVMGAFVAQTIESAPAASDAP